MKESIGSTQLFIIVVIMVMIFASIISFTTNRSNAYAVKDAIISVIEDNNGINDINKDNVLDEIIQEITDYGYGIEGEEIAGYECYQKNKSLATSGKSNASFCYKKIAGNTAEGTVKDKNTYKVVVFYGLKFPFFGDKFTFKMIGETKGVG